MFSLLKFCQPLVLCLLLLVAALLLSKRRRLRQGCLWLAVATLLVCGNGWLVKAMTRHLERQFSTPKGNPQADCLVVLSGGVLGRIPPRSTVEVDDAGDRVLHAAYLYRQGWAAHVICTGGFLSSANRSHPASEDMQTLLEMLGVPTSVIIQEAHARNTHEHAVNLLPIFIERGYKRVVLITSARHMPRSVAVFRHLCPDIEFIPAPTDFRAPDSEAVTWCQELGNLVPTARNLVSFSESIHEYVGMAYYRMRGWS